LRGLYTTIGHLQCLLEALYSDELRLGTARLSGTDELVAVLVDVELVKWGKMFTTTPGVLKCADEPFVDQGGKLTAAARAVFETWKVHALDTDHETWFNQDPDGRVHVHYAKRGAPSDRLAALITLPWNDPDEMFLGTVVAG
jgi:hypothetical protein